MLCHSPTTTIYVRTRPCITSLPGNTWPGLCRCCRCWSFNLVSKRHMHPEFFQPQKRVDLSIFHGKGEAGRRLAEYRLFVHEPALPGSSAALADVQDKLRLPFLMAAGTCIICQLTGTVYIRPQDDSRLLPASVSVLRRKSCFSLFSR